MSHESEGHPVRKTLVAFTAIGATAALAVGAFEVGRYWDDVQELNARRSDPESTPTPTPSPEPTLSESPTPTATPSATPSETATPVGPSPLACAAQLPEWFKFGQRTMLIVTPKQLETSADQLGEKTALYGTGNLAATANPAHPRKVIEALQASQKVELALGYSDNLEYSDDLTKAKSDKSIAEQSVQAWQDGMDVASFSLSDTQMTTKALDEQLLAVMQAGEAALRGGELTKRSLNESVVQILQAKGVEPCEVLDVIGKEGESPAPESPLAAISKVLVVVEENHSLQQMKQGMPTAFSWAEQYGYATGYEAIRHPSLPNYIALASGDTQGITDDGKPSANEFNGTSVFGQAIKNGRTAKVYAEAMPENCYRDNKGDYAVRHNPWTYFKNERDLCAKYDVPASEFKSDVANGTLPNVSMLIPNLENDAHDASLKVADTWLKEYLAPVFDTEDFKSGKLAVIITADEDDKKSGNKVLTVVAHPSLDGKVATTKLTHYSLSGLLSQVAGGQPLEKAQAAPNMADAFDLEIASE